jgi:uncharacterized membrane protein
MFPIYLVHPMIVHFPIVLLLAVPVIDFYSLVRRGDLAVRSCVPDAALLALLAGVAAGVVAIIFGDIASDHAVAAGFPTAPIEQHEGFATTTVVFFAVIAAFRLFARWRGISLAGGRGWLFLFVTLVGTALVITTAYFGGHLVYDGGVNVATIKP